MFIGHYAVGFGAKRFAPRASLTVLIAAPLFLDLLWPLFILLGWEKVRIDPGNTAVTPLDFISYPFSHSLVMSIVWATLFAAVYYGLSKYWAGTVAVWIGVVSHWFLDFASHRPDMPLFPGGGSKLGLGLWNSVPATMIVEGLIFLLGVWLYVRTTRPKDKVGRFAFGSFVALLIVLYASNFFAPPPPSIKALAVVALSLSSLLVWIGWFDSHREMA